jgi:hypothetical protein
MTASVRPSAEPASTLSATAFSSDHRHWTPLRLSRAGCSRSSAGRQRRRCGPGSAGADGRSIALVRDGPGGCGCCRAIKVAGALPEELKSARPALTAFDFANLNACIDREDLDGLRIVIGQILSQPVSGRRQESSDGGPCRPDEVIMLGVTLKKPQHEFSSTCKPLDLPILPALVWGPGAAEPADRPHPAAEPARRRYEAAA